MKARVDVSGAVTAARDALEATQPDFNTIQRAIGADLPALAALDHIRGAVLGAAAVLGGAAKGDGA